MSRTAFITGATSGFGLAATRRFVAAGWKVVATGRRRERLQALVDELGAANVHPACFDVRDTAAMDAALATLPEGFGGIDVLVNNAGLGTSCRVVDMADSEWHKVLDVTLTGTFRMMRAALKVMQPRGKGVIINNASVLGWRAWRQKSQCQLPPQR